MQEGTTFQPVLECEHNPSPSATTRLILCSGKHYYTLLDHLSQSQNESLRACTSLIRIEELSPFPRAQLRDILGKYIKNDVKVIWAQEEPENQGAWTFVKPRIEEVLRDSASGGTGIEVGYAGRKSGATVATAVGDWHKRELKEIVDDAFA
jgi:probable 2-oxoglutarate dehydrogenase E1 component DHKTD1